MKKKLQPAITLLQQYMAQDMTVYAGHATLFLLTAFFPLLMWLLAYGSKLFLLKTQHVPVLKVVLPILASLLAIRLLARVLAAVFPNSHLARVVERVVMDGEQEITFLPNLLGSLALYRVSR